MARIQRDFPRRTEVRDTWIELSDGVRLFARIVLPIDAETDPVPALLEYLPYRKCDGTALRDARHHPWYAGHGYASVRVDMRGSGDSEACSSTSTSRRSRSTASRSSPGSPRSRGARGAVGMFGISWGGFNALQIAARRPPALQAVISLCSTDDRYADDVHYMGGCVLEPRCSAGRRPCSACNARPPDPRVRRRALARDVAGAARGNAAVRRDLARHQRRDAYWKQGSICEDYAAIECPVYTVGGWADGYTNADPADARRPAACPRKGLIGPWAHGYPQLGAPGPQIGFLQEALRWWDHWLKGDDDRDHGRADAARLDAGARAARHGYASRPGRWVAEAALAVAEHRDAACFARRRRRARAAHPAPPAAATRGATRPRAPTAGTGARTAPRPTSRATSGRRTRSR